MTIAIYSSSRGNYFFNEIRDLLAAGLRRAGRRVIEADERRGFLPGAALHLIIAPHEFFYLGSGLALRGQNWPAGVLLYNTEQLGSQWYPMAERLFPRAHAVWDIDAAGARCAAAAGHRAAHIPPGWAPCTLLKTVRRLASGAREAWLEGPDPGPLQPWARRPLDLLFVGAHTPRREAFLAGAASDLARWRSALLMREGTRPALPGRTTDLDTSVLLGLAQRAKVVLNIHRSSARFFEWHRIALHGMAQGALVVTEPCSDASPFAPGRHFIAAPLGEIPRVLARLLGTAAGRRQAARVAAAGQAAFRALDLGDILRRELAALENPRPKAAVHKKALGRAAPVVRTVASGGRGGTTPAVTVAVSLHDYERVIGACLNSAHAQTLLNLDLIVVDDASGDGSLKTARRWLARRGQHFSRWLLLAHDCNAGLAAARNTAFRAARTAAVLVLDADNLLLPRCAARLWAALERTGADAAYPLLERFGEEQGIMNLKPWDWAGLRKENTIDALALVRRSSWRRLDGYRSFLGWEDYDFWLRLAGSGGRASQVPEILARYRVHLGSMLHTVTHANAGELHRLFRLEHGMAFEGDGGSLPRPPRIERHALALFKERLEAGR